MYIGANKMSWRHIQAHGWPKSADGAALASLEERQREAEARKGNAFVRLGKASRGASTHSQFTCDCQCLHSSVLLPPPPLQQPTMVVCVRMTIAILCTASTRDVLD